MSLPFSKSYFFICEMGTVFNTIIHCEDGRDLGQDVYRSEVIFLRLELRMSWALYSIGSLELYSTDDG